MEKLRLFKCNVCGDAFSELVDLANHVNTHLRPPKHDEKCHICDQTQVGQNLQNHVESHLITGGLMTVEEGSLLDTLKQEEAPPPMKPATNLSQEIITADLENDENRSQGTIAAESTNDPLKLTDSSDESVPGDISNWIADQEIVIKRINQGQNETFKSAIIEANESVLEQREQECPFCDYKGTSMMNHVNNHLIEKGIVHKEFKIERVEMKQENPPLNILSQHEDKSFPQRDEKLGYEVDPVVEKPDESEVTECPKLQCSFSDSSNESIQGVSERMADQEFVIKRINPIQNETFRSEIVEANESVLQEREQECPFCDYKGTSMMNHVNNHLIEKGIVHKEFKIERVEIKQENPPLNILSQDEDKSFFPQRDEKLGYEVDPVMEKCDESEVIKCAKPRCTFGMKEAYKIYGRYLNITWSKEGFQCKLCDRKLKTKQSLIYHLNSRKHFGIKPFKCRICSMAFVSHPALSQHVLYHHSKGKKKYQCTICDEKFFQKCKLNHHLTFHGDDKPYQCPHCPKSFRAKFNMIRHVRIHTGCKPHQCDICLQSFNQHQTLTRHVRERHGNQFANLECKICKKVLKRKHELVAHRRHYHSVQRMECSKCSFVCMDYYSLKLHKKKKHGRNEKKKCALCSYQTVSSKSLLSHFEKKHNCVKKEGKCKKQKFRCNYCGKKYVFEKVLKKHMKKHANEEDNLETSEEKSSESSSGSQQNSERSSESTECPICHEKDFKNPRGLQRHIGAMHAKPMPEEGGQDLDFSKSEEEEEEESLPHEPMDLSSCNASEVYQELTFSSAPELKDL